MTQSSDTIGSSDFVESRVERASDAAAVTVASYTLACSNCDFSLTRAN